MKFRDRLSNIWQHLRHPTDKDKRKIIVDSSTKKTVTTTTQTTETGKQTSTGVVTGSLTATVSAPAPAVTVSTPAPAAVTSSTTVAAVTTTPPPAPSQATVVVEAKPIAAAASAVKDDLGEIKDGVVNTAKAAAKTTEHAVEVVAVTAEHVAEKTADAAKRAVEATVDTAKTVAHETANAAEHVAEKTVDTAKHAVEATVDTAKTVAHETVTAAEHVAEKTVEVTEHAAHATADAVEHAAKVVADKVGLHHEEPVAAVVAVQPAADVAKPGPHPVETVEHKAVEAKDEVVRAADATAAAAVEAKEEVAHALDATATAAKDEVVRAADATAAVAVEAKEEVAHALDATATAAKEEVVRAADATAAAVEPVAVQASQSNVVMFKKLDKLANPAPDRPTGAVLEKVDTLRRQLGNAIKDPSATDEMKRTFSLLDNAVEEFQGLIKEEEADRAEFKDDDLQTRKQEIEAELERLGKEAEENAAVLAYQTLFYTTQLRALDEDKAKIDAKETIEDVKEFMKGLEAKFLAEIETLKTAIQTSTRWCYGVSHCCTPDELVKMRAKLADMETHAKDMLSDDLDKVKNASKAVIDHVKDGIEVPVEKVVEATHIDSLKDQLGKVMEKIEQDTKNQYYKIKHGTMMAMLKLHELIERAKHVFTGTPVSAAVNAAELPNKQSFVCSTANDYTFDQCHEGFSKLSQQEKDDVLNGHHDHVLDKVMPVATCKQACSM